MKIYDRSLSTIKIPLGVEVELETGEYLEILDPLFQDKGWRPISYPSHPTSFRVLKESV